MNIEVIKAGIEYKPEIFDLVIEFYGTRPDEPLANKLKGCIAELLNYPKYGSAFIIKYSGEVVGYIILTFGYSLEYGGRDSFIDEFYIRSEHRNKGVGEFAIDYVLKYARTAGIKTVHLQVKEKHHEAQKLYLKKEFKEHDGSFMYLNFE